MDSIKLATSLFQSSRFHPEFSGQTLQTGIFYIIRIDGSHHTRSTWIGDFSALKQLLPKVWDYLKGYKTHRIEVLNR